jgi:hypothetical protein
MISFFFTNGFNDFFVMALLIWTAVAFVFKQPALIRWALWASGCAGVVVVAQVLFLCINNMAA